MSTEFEFDAKVKEADDIDIKEYSFSPTLLENGVIDYSNIEHDKIFLVNKHDILEKEKPDWIPELDLDGLMADEFLPTTIKSSDGFYYVQAKKLTDILDNKNDPNKRYETQIYKMSSDILAATVDYYIKKQKALNKQVEKKETFGLPRRTKSMYTSRFQNMVDLLRFIPEYKENEALLKHYPNRSKSEAYRKQNKIIFDQYKDLLGNLKDKILDLNLDKIDYGNAYIKGEITSYGDKGLSNSLYEDFGVRIKKQNGSTFSLEQKNRVESVLKDTYSYYGDLSNISKDFHLKVSYADNCNQHARKVIGLFSPFHNAIGVSFFDDNTYERTTAAHEFAHFLDYIKGNEFSYRYASDKDGSLENQIATKYKKLIREQNENNKSKVGESKTIKLGDYWYRTCECFARAMEQDFELTIGLKEKCEPPAYLPEEIFNKEIKPLIEELKKENEIKLNLIPKNFVTLTTKMENKRNEERKGQEIENMSDVFDNKIENNEEYANELADWIIQESLECSVNKENYHISFEDIVEKTNTPIEWLNQNYKLVNEALAKHNDNELLEYNPKESNENEFNLNFCSNATENDENTLFKQNKQGRWVRKTEEELELELKNNTKTIENAELNLIAPKYEIPRTSQTKDFKSDVIKNKGKTITYKGEDYQIGDYEAGDNLLLPKVYLTQYGHNTKWLYEKEFYKTIEFDSIFETVSKEFNEKNKDFFNFYEEKKSEQIENLSKNISNIKEKMLFSKIHSEMLKIRVEELKEMVKRCPNKDIALAVGIRYFNYFGNIEGNISHQNLYTRFGIGHYEKDQMVYPKPEELNSFISKLYENSKKQETYIWNHYEDGSCCLKAPNGEKYFVYDPDADEVKITEDSNWIRSEELNLGDKTFTQYAEDYILENNAATYISFETNGKNIEKEQNVDESKQYSFFVKDTAEFEMFEEFETITGLTAKEAISEYKRLREDGLKAGIGINIPSDTTFDDPKGLGTTILVRDNGVDTFDIYGDSFIVDLKENNEKSQNRIAAYKELYEELQRAGLNVKEPKFLFDKHLELNNHKDSGEISIYRNKIFQINWLVKTLNISSETADMFYDNYTVYEEVGKNYPDWNYEKNTITIFEERNNKLDYYEVSPLEICEIALKHAKNKEEIEIIKTVMAKQNSLEKENEVMPKIDSYRINHNHDYFLSQKAIEFRIEQAKALTKAFFVENWEQSSKDEFVQKAMEYTLEPNSTVLFDKYLKEKEVEVYTKEEQEKMEQANNSIKEIVEQYSKELFVTYNQKEKLNKFWSEADIVDTVPDGWKKDQGVTTVPNGYVAITNGKSRFADGEKRETKLIREENYKQTELELDFGLIPMMPKIELKEPEKQIIKEEVKLPFSIINNVEKGRVNIKFDQKISDKKFNSILKELKSAGWRFSSFNKQWYPVGKAVEKSETFVKELQEKFAKSEETITYATASFEEFSQTLTESQIQKSPYDGIKFFDRNYKEIDEFVAYFNRNLNVFGKDVAPIDEKIAETIFESLQVDRVGTLNSRTIRLGLDASDNLVLLNKEKNEIETKNITLKELFFLAKETLEKEKQSLDEMLEKFNKKDNKEQFISVFGNLFQSAKDNNTELINKMDVIYDAYIKKPTQQTKKISKVQLLKVGDYIGDEVVQDVLEMAKGVYQATLMKNINEGPGTYFILDKNIVEKLNPELHQFLEEKEEHAIFKTSSRTTPHIIKELIDKNLCPPRDKEYYHQLDLHIQKNPLKYEVLYPVTKSNFKNKLKKLYEIDKHINHDVLTMGKQLLSFAIKDEKEEISRWLKDDVGCEDEKLLKNVFTKWVLEKEIIQEKNKDGYPPRGE